MSEKTWEIWQDGIRVVTVDACNIESGRSEIMHYALLYMQDGPIEIRGPDTQWIFDTLTGRTH